MPRSLITIALALLLSRAAGAAEGTTGEAAKPVPPRPSNGSGGKAGAFPDESIKVGGVKRSYRLVVPESIDLTKPVPVLFAFHGFLLDSAEIMARYSRLADLAEKKQFILCFPQGLERRWEILKEENRDLAFFDSLREHLERTYNVDRNRIFATGMSNGGYFSNLLASKRSDVIAAIAPHSGGLGLLTLNGVNAKRKYPVLVIHGTADNIVPVSEAHRCCEVYEKEGHLVQYEELKGYPHFWGRKFDVNTKMWDFFEKHALSEAALSE